ncbi:mannosyltransferase KTR3 SKDI_02G3130 [Saccharomyces kudriavzevii IFO 1802]|nr:uncharacterized protein SKDI_02G3130 [Saccharomyces kudriavzevii IFO 1802]CAI4055869.1 hypothetical protein SKDI_02G3130 [Saccharomyces kudriavzevii IFO 1802]
MPVHHKKKLMPKSALLIRKYQRGIRASFIGLILVLSVLFLMSGSKPSEVLITQSPSTSQVAKKDYQMPFTDKSQDVIHPMDDGKKEKGVMVTLARNSDLWNLVKSIRHVEDRFNNRYHYDWVFLNDEPFNDEFKRVTSALVSGKTKYGTIPKEHWSIPPSIDINKFDKKRKEMGKLDIPYGTSVPYRHMCRFQSGFIWRHALLDEYEWFWRVDTDITLFCDIEYDIFKFLKVNKKKYGFILSLSEYEGTIPTLWKTTKEFTKKNPKFLNKNNLMNFISDDDGETYNMCHFWTNFEVGSLDFFRSDAYTQYFDYLDESGGFFYERWGDAPVHSIAASLFLDKSEIHFFDGLGFHHPDFTSCPIEQEIRLQNKCICEPRKDVTWGTSYFCTRKYFSAGHYKLPPGI